MVFVRFCCYSPSILYRFDVISAFVIAENGRKTISAGRGRVKPEVKSPFFRTPNCAFVIVSVSPIDFSEHSLFGK
jgi:hypothetical protein